MSVRAPDVLLHTIPRTTALFLALRPVCQRPSKYAPSRTDLQVLPSYSLPSGSTLVDCDALRLRLSERLPAMCTGSPFITRPCPLLSIAPSPTAVAHCFKKTQKCAVQNLVHRHQHQHPSHPKGGREARPVQQPGP